MKTLFIVYLALVVLALSACQKAETDATVPTVDSQCVNNPNLCQQNIYNNTPGYTPYNYNNQYNNGFNNGFNNYNNYNYNYNYQYRYNQNYYVNPFTSYNNSNYLCNCPSGSVPTYNSYAGLGCVQTSQVYGYGGYGYAYFGWGGANNSQWVNIPQISNHVGYTGNGGCYNGVIQSCLVDQPNTCSVGYSCQTSSAASRVGLCIATSAVNNGNGSQVR